MKIKLTLLGLIFAMACSQTVASAEFVDAPAGAAKRPIKITKIKSGTFEGTLKQDEHFLEATVNKDPLCVQWLSKLSSKEIEATLSLQVRGQRATLRYDISGDVRMKGVIKGKINRDLAGMAHFTPQGRLPLIGYESVDRIALIQKNNGELAAYVHLSEEIDGSTGAPFCETAYN